MYPDSLLRRTRVSRCNPLRSALRTARAVLSARCRRHALTLVDPYVAGARPGREGGRLLAQRHRQGRGRVGAAGGLSVCLAPLWGAALAQPRFSLCSPLVFACVARLVHMSAPVRGTRDGPCNNMHMHGIACAMRAGTKRLAGVVLGALS